MKKLPYAIFAFAARPLFRATAPDAACAVAPTRADPPKTRSLDMKDRPSRPAGAFCKVRGGRPDRNTLSIEDGRKARRSD